MKEPQGELEIIREFSCGCIVYRVYVGEWPKCKEVEERGLFCDGIAVRITHGRPKHAKTLVKGAETQPSLFS